MDPFCCSLISEQNKVKKIHFFIKNDELQTTGQGGPAAFEQIPGRFALTARIYHDYGELNDANRKPIFTP
jgi:hypothetical protein